jgi:hypothetical protein
MADQVLSLRISLAALQAKPLRKLQRIIDVVRFTKAGASLVLADHYPPQDFFTLNPSNNTQLSLEDARATARDWVVLHALRDAIEAVAVFLEDVRLLAAVYQLSAKSEIKGSEWNAVFADGRPFHRLGLPDKINRIRSAYGIESDFDSHVLSLNVARNCIVHRGGVVTPLDLNEQGELQITFAQFVIMATRPDGSSIEVTEPGVFEAGTSLGVRIGPRTKTIHLGEQIVLTYDELQFAVFTHQNYVNNMTASLQKYAEALGVKFTSPMPAA